MSFMNLLVFADASDASAPRLETAIAMAERFGAQLSACALAEQPAYYYGIGTEVAADIYVQDIERAKAVADEVAGIARPRLAKSERDGGVRSATGTAAAISEIVARQARYADLSLVGQPFDSAEETLLTKVLEGVLFDAGRPMVMVPRRWAAGAFGERVMIAWTSCKEAARAVDDAMPFIEAAESVHIAMIDPDTGANAHGEEPGADLAASLARHGVRVTVDPLPSGGRSVAERLLTHATDCDANLIVMGGYGHWRLRETLFGGVTRDMIRQSTVPILLAH
ncbi:MAG TPA: universal stress protein [Thermohalobaculum sp.]|nr:universal stress protein [Thermohalobaculum sp.]